MAVAVRGWGWTIGPWAGSFGGAGPGVLGALVFSAGVGVSARVRVPRGAGPAWRGWLRALGGLPWRMGCLGGWAGVAGGAAVLTGCWGGFVCV